MIRPHASHGIYVLAIILIAAVSTALPAASGEARPAGRPLRIVASLFPQYDFARQIAGDLAEVRLLLPPGAESHSFEPTPADMQAIAQADLFIYTGESMEPWARRLAVAAEDSGASGESVSIVDASVGIHLLASDSFFPEAGEEEDEDEGENEDHENRHHHSHGASDPHIWLDPLRAAHMVQNIADAMARRDPENRETYQTRATAIREELFALDDAFMADVHNASRHTIVFGERFAFGYFIHRYRLRAVSPYTSCAPGAEPGLRAVMDVVKTMKDEGIRVIYREEMATDRIASVLVEETDARVQLVDSLHNPPASRQAKGETFQTIMRRNMDEFRKGLE